MSRANFISLPRLSMFSFARILVMLFLTVAVARFNLDPISLLVYPAANRVNICISRSVRVLSSGGSSLSLIITTLINSGTVLV